MYLFGSLRGHTHPFLQQPNCVFTPPLHLQGLDFLGYWWQCPLSDALGPGIIPSPCQGGAGCGGYTGIFLCVLCWETEHNIKTHTQAHKTTTRGLSCQILLLLSPASSKQVPLFHWCCCLLTICAQFWDSQSQECQTGLAENLAACVSVCALGNRAPCVWLWAAPVQQRGGEGHNPAGKGPSNYLQNWLKKIIPVKHIFQ